MVRISVVAVVVGTLIAGPAGAIGAPVEPSQIGPSGVSAAQAQAIAEPYAEGQPHTTSVTTESRTTDDISAAQPVYKVTMLGSFVYHGASVPPGSAAPEGKRLEVTINRENGLVQRVGLREPPTETSDTAQAARAKPTRHYRRAKAATWGPGCSYSGTHCYAIADWIMSGSERVEGIVDEVDTEYMDVYEWPAAFVNDEEWAEFSENHWVEIGTTAGRGVNCCSLSWFHAWKNAGGYEQVLNEGPVTAGTWPWFWMKWSGSGNTWCWKIGEHGEATVECESGFQAYSTRLMDGMEIASEGQPNNFGNVVTSYQALSGEWRTWNKATNEASPGATCVVQFQPHPGNIHYETCL